MLLPALLLSACTTPLIEPNHKRSNSSVSRIHRENTMQAAWSGRSYHALVEAFGSPHMIMALPNYRPAKTTIVVYGTADKASNCIDSFTLIPNEHEGEFTVADYFCR
jgi:hypothetical protein